LLFWPAVGILGLGTLVLLTVSVLTRRTTFQQINASLLSFPITSKSCHQGAGENAEMPNAEFQRYQLRIS
jgi:hypothetical protein